MNRSRVFPLMVLCTGFVLVAVDMTIVNVALPSMQRDLRFSQSNLAWIVNAYLIPYAGCLLLAGRLGDIVGRKRVFMTGLAIFSSASLLCAVSPSQQMLIGFRILQGIGGAGSSAVVLGMIVNLFPDPREQARAIAVFSVGSSIGSALGLLAGGLITQAINWHWIFIVNVPIGLITVLCARPTIETDARSVLRAGADVVGAVLVTAGLMVAVYTVLQSAASGWASLRTLATGVLSLVLLCGFIARQWMARDPLLPLRIFHSRVLSAANLIQAAVTAAVLSFFFLGSLDFERALGYAPMSIGLAFLPVAIATGVCSMSSSRLVTRFGPRAVLIAGEEVIAVAMALFAFSPLEGGYFPNFLVPMILLEVGGALFFPPLVMLAMSGIEPSGAGLASGLLNTSGQIGGALGLAALATLAGRRTAQLIKVGGSTATTALATGYHFAWMLGFVILLAAIALTVPVLRAPTKPRVVWLDKSALAT